MALPIHFHILNSIENACIASLVVMNSLSFFLSRKDFISFSLMKLNSAGYKVFYWISFSSRRLKIGPQHLLVWKVSAEKSTVSLMVFPLQLISHFFLTTFRTFSFMLTLDHLMTICHGEVCLVMCLPGVL